MSQTGLSVDNSRISPFRETRETFPKRLKTCDRHLSQRRGHRARSGASVAILAGALAREPAPGASKRERSPTSAPRLSPDQRKNPRNSGGFRVRDTGIEPVTSSVSVTKRPCSEVKWDASISGLSRCFSHFHSHRVKCRNGAQSGGLRPVCYPPRAQSCGQFVMAGRCQVRIYLRSAERGVPEKFGDPLDGDTALNEP